MATDDTYDLEIVQGERLKCTFIYADENEVAQSVAAYDAFLQVRDKPGGTVMLSADSTSPTGGIEMEPNGATGEVFVNVGADETALVTKSGQYDIFLVSKTDPTDAILLIEGRAPLNKRITVPT